MTSPDRPAVCYPSDSVFVHAGVRPGEHGSVTNAIEVSTTFSMPFPGQTGAYDYARAQNPTREALEDALAAAESAQYGRAFSSGLAAIDAVLRLVKPGSSVIVGNDAYGGTWRLLTRVWADYGINTLVVDTTDLDTLENAWPTNVAMVLVETPSNPTLRVTDIRRLAVLAHRNGALICVDNTFASPYLQQPLQLGADMVVHSTTKYIGGHSDVVGGFVATNDETIAEHLSFQQKAVGAVPGPFDCFLVMRGLRTLPLRMRRHCDNARRVAEFLSDHPKVSTVHFPGLSTHPNHSIAAEQMRDFGGMISFTVVGGEEAALAVCAATKVFTLAESLGGVESLIEHPGRMTHASTSGSQLEVDPALVRISVGVEDVEDLIADLAAALAGA